jgi:hypothetical protein
VPLEALRMADCRQEKSVLSAEVRKGIVDATDAMRTFLAGRRGCSPYPAVSAPGEENGRG